MSPPAIATKQATLLLLVHVGDMFRESFPPGYLGRVVRACRKADWVIHFDSLVESDGPVDALECCIDQHITWGWGYEPEQFGVERGEEGYDNFELAKNWVVPCNAHEWTWVPEEIRDEGLWKGFSDILLGGGCDGSCLLDMEEILNDLDIEYRKDPLLVYC